MTLKDLKNKFDNLGYLTQIHDSITFLTLALPDDKGQPKLGSISRIEARDEKIFYVYYKAQLPVEMVFAEEQKLVDFVTGKYPVG